MKTYAEEIAELKYKVVDQFVPDTLGQIEGPVIEVPLLAKEQRWGLELLFAHTDSYTGKVLYRRGDPTYKGRVQYHRYKAETFFLLSGTCLLRLDKGDGKLSEEIIGPGRSFHIPRGARHSVISLTDSVMFEVSTPHFEDRRPADAEYNVEGEANWHALDESSPELVNAVLKAIGA